MTNKIRNIVLLLAMLLSSMQAWAEYRPTKIYAFGFSSSFNDSTIYVTEVMEIDSAWVEKKYRFLYSRENYSYQLKEFMKQNGVARPTCSISFSKSKKKIEKKREKLLKKYRNAKTSYTINILSDTMFRFQPISAADDYEASHKLTKEEKKALKREIKQKKAEIKAEKKAKKLKNKQFKAENKAKRKAAKAENKQKMVKKKGRKDLDKQMKKKRK